MTKEIIVEIGQNFDGNLDLAKEMLTNLASTGARLVKFQLYDAKKLFSSIDNPWYEYNCKTELSFDAFKELVLVGRKLNLDIFASVFDIDRLDWLLDLGVTAVKIASRSIDDFELIERLNLLEQKFSDIYASLGYWNGQGIPDFFPKKTKFLYCVSKYPTPLEELNMNQDMFNGKFFGFSDHTLGISAAVHAFSLGAQVVEKHFSHDKNSYGPDHACSMDIFDLKRLIEFLTDLQKINKVV